MKIRGRNYLLFNNLPILVTLAILLFSCLQTKAQSAEYRYFYRVYFKDKGENIIADYTLSDLLSPKAILRREKYGITVPDMKDIPVSENYTHNISDSGFVLHTTSKWMNTALFKSDTYIDIQGIINLPFVSDVRIVKSPFKSETTSNKLKIDYIDLATPAPYDHSLTMLNGHLLHQAGYKGNNVSIAVLDGGFYNALILPSLQELKGRNGISGNYDFILKNENVYDYSDHGTAVLTVLGGNLANQIKGTAPGADYWLFRTEDGDSEYPVEEDYWIAAAERADSLGADIITSSLGYTVFDDPSLNYDFNDLDGNTAFITKAADIAASKGILVIVSAGNERDNEWQRIAAPSDGDSVISVGAVDRYSRISFFSSAGPSSDGRIKPDNAAMGVDVPIQTTPTSVLRASGTSFSCPVLSGLCACLIQAVPQASNIDIINALHRNGDRYNSPDSLFGYGIPDMMSSFQWLSYKLTEKPKLKTIVSPNPVKDIIEISFIEPPGDLFVEIFSTTGTLVFSKSYAPFNEKSLKISELQSLSQGMYIIRLKTSFGTFSHKIIKLND